MMNLIEKRVGYSALLAGALALMDLCLLVEGHMVSRWAGPRAPLPPFDLPSAESWGGRFVGAAACAFGHSLGKIALSILVVYIVVLITLRSKFSILCINSSFRAVRYIPSVFVVCLNVFSFAVLFFSGFLFENLFRTSLAFCGVDIGLMILFVSFGMAILFIPLALVAWIAGIARDQN